MKMEKETGRPESSAPNGNLRKRPPELQEEMARRLMEGECTQKELSAWLAAVHGIQAGQSRISAWFAWYTAKQDEQFWRKAIRGRLAAEARRNGEMSEEELFRAGQMVFAERALEQRNIDDWVAVQRMMLRGRMVRLARQRVEAENYRVKAVDAGKTQREGVCGNPDI